MLEAARPFPLPHGSTIGILGSGQLGRMLAMAAARLGLKTHVYCEESGPAFDVATRTTKAPFNDETALTAFAHTVDADHRHHVCGGSLVALPSLADRGLPQSARGGSAARSRSKQSRAASV